MDKALRHRVGLWGSGVGLHDPWRSLPTPSCPRITLDPSRNQRETALGAGMGQQGGRGVGWTPRQGTGAAAPPHCSHSIGILMPGTRGFTSGKAKLGEGVARVCVWRDGRTQEQAQAQQCVPCAAEPTQNTACFQPPHAPASTSVQQGQ